MQNTIVSGNAAEKKVALITGATSGIGRAFACEFARQDYDLILTGRRKEILEQVASEIRMVWHVSVQVIIADLSDDGTMQQLVQVIGEHPELEVLVNNAGYGIGRVFHEHPVAQQLEMVKVHITAPLMFIHKALPAMIERKKGIIINVSSLAAFTPARTNIMYSSTKAFILNFSESLHLEVRRHGIRIQCLCPGYTHSDFHNRIGSTAFPKSKRLIRWMEPDEVVKYSMFCLDRGRMRCIPGLMNRFMVMLIPFVPRRIYYFFATVLQQEPSGEASAPDRKKDLQQTQVMG